jgi:dTDP-4-dehydrorhamnose reductase
MKSRVLVLGASGMLGNAVYRFLTESEDYDVFGTLRSERSRKYFSESLQSRLISEVDEHGYPNTGIWGYASACGYQLHWIG